MRREGRATQYDITTQRERPAQTENNSQESSDTEQKEPGSKEVVTRLNAHLEATILCLHARRRWWWWRRRGRRE